MLLRSGQKRSHSEAEPIAKVLVEQVFCRFGSPVPKPKHILKPPKYDGTGSFETFLAQFQNCALYNKWTNREQLVYLRSCLEKDAGQVLWDYSAETASFPRMIKVLKERFGEANQSDKYRF